MALIPNESYGFPDDVTMGVIRPQKTKRPRAQAPQIKTQRRPGSVTPKKTLPPLPPLPAPLALARARTQGMTVKHAAPRVQRREKDRTREPIPVTPAVSHIEELQIDLFDRDSESSSKGSPHSRWIRFVVLELIALCVLIPSGWLTLQRVLTDPGTLLLLNILTISAAAAVAIIPIVVFAIALHSRAIDVCRSTDLSILYRAGSIRIRIEHRSAAV
jgi:hypothetical protein